MNAASNIGSNSLAVFYSFAMVSALLLPKWSIQTFGCKNVLLAGMIASCCYIASNVYLCVETMVAASILYGVVISPYISAQSLYVNEMAIRFQLTTRNNIETVMAYFFGIYAFFLESSQVSGNIISYFVLRIPSYVVERRNSSVSNTCGINFDSENSANITNANLLPPPEIERIVLISIFVAMGILAVILAGFFLESVMSTEKNVNGFQFICHSFVANLLHLKNYQQVLLIPISILIGLQSSFFSNEVTLVSKLSLTRYLIARLFENKNPFSF
ncbi:uncharacterized protein TNIN_212421 [Trichonephila inaurata madagascariensis]|uniref:Uncharacterized protein n=1 Tax=Trichonephila inaurata madagascariensis TaxID=2747483 RepID=A0A8X7C8D1_9ARAC|nr:uncharacterized protein TNIN_212421 [Trichonephila inaurata madagascariensis]